MAKKVVAELREQQRQFPDAADEAFCIQAFENQSHRQIVKHRDRRFAALPGAALQMAAQEHSRPARQLQRQTLQIAAPVRLIRPEAPQLLGNHLQRVVRQLIDRAPCAGQIVKPPAHVQAGTEPPGGKKTLRPRRVVPGGQPLIEVRCQMTNQRWSQ